MTNAYAGGGDYFEQNVQQVAQTMMQDMPEPSLWESLTYEIGDHFGYGWIIGLAAFGAVYFFRNKLKQLLKDYLK